MKRLLQAAVLASLITTATLLARDRSILGDADRSAKPYGREIEYGRTMAVLGAISKADAAVRAIETPEILEAWARESNAEGIEFVARILLHAPIYDSADMRSWLRASAAPFQGDAKRLDHFRIRVLRGDDFERRLRELAPAQSFSSPMQAFYSEKEGTAYIRAEAAATAIKLVTLMMHEALHAYMPRSGLLTPDVEEGAVTLLMARVLQNPGDNRWLEWVKSQMALDFIDQVGPALLDGGQPKNCLTP